MMAERTDFYGSNTPKCPKSPCSFQKTGCSFHSFEPILSKRAKKKSPANPLVYRTFWRRVRDSNPRFLLGTQHFECDALRPLYGNFLSEAVRYGSAKTRTATGFFGGRIQKIALFRRFLKMGSNHEKLRFWAELGTDGAEQRQNGNTRTAHRQFCYFEVYCK